MAETPAQAVKEKLNIVDVVRGYIELQPAGRNFKARCPFHREKTPSFIVSPDRQTFKCFGCNEGGDIFTFVMKHESLEFGEALKILAEKAGVELRRMSPMEYKQFGVLYDVNDAAKEFYKSELRRSAEARDYLGGRKLAQETIDEFELGFAPEGRDALTVHLVNGGFDIADLIRAGVTAKNERGLTFDRFRGRIMFPILNHSGKVVGFTGRILPRFERDDIGKYVNSPETPIFKKSKLLYGFSAAKRHIRDAGKVFLVEGQMDVLMSRQSGARHTVASSGTALTPDHLHALSRITDRIVFGLDTDEAGRAALERAIDLAKSMDFEVGIASSDPYKDPADAAAADPAHIVRMIEQATPALDFYFDYHLPKGVLDPRDRSHLQKLRVVLAKIIHIASAAERERSLDALALRTGVSGTALREELEHLREPEPDAAHKAAAPGSPPRNLSRLEYLSERILSSASVREAYGDIADIEQFLAAGYADILRLLAEGRKRTENLDLDRRIDAILLAPQETSPGELDALKNELRRAHLKEERERLIREAKIAEHSGDEGALTEVLRKLSRLPSA